MEKRFYLGIGILLVFLLLGLTVSWAMRQVTQPVAQMLEQAAQEVLSGNMEQGILLARQAQTTWQKGWKCVALAADHSPMDEIDGLFAQIGFFAESGNRQELGACCVRVSELVEAVADAHGLTWWNVI